MLKYKCSSIYDVALSIEQKQYGKELQINKKIINRHPGEGQKGMCYFRMCQMLRNQHLQIMTSRGIPG